MGFDGQMRTRLFDLVKVTFLRHRDMCIAFCQVLSHVDILISNGKESVGFRYAIRGFSFILV